MIRHGFWAGLLGCAVWLAAPAPATAQQQYCSIQGRVYTCNLPAAQYSSGLSFAAPIDTHTPFPIVLPISVTAAGDITAAASSSQNSALGVSATGATIFGIADTTGMEVTNTGSLTVTSGQSPNAIYGLSAAMIGGPSGDTYTSGQPLKQPLIITNTGTIILQGVESSGGSALYGLAQGGDALLDEGDSGGSSGGVAIANSGTIDATITANGYGGIEALAGGGQGSTDKDEAGGNGGNSQSSTVTSSAPVSVTLTWNSSSSSHNSGVYGVLAQSVGGIGGNATDGDNGGAGGYGSLATVSLAAGADVSVSAQGTAPTSSSFLSPSAGVSAAIIGGDGGNLQDCGALCGKGTSAGNAGYVSYASIVVTDANVTTSGDSLPGLLLYERGGAGGNGGDNPTYCGDHTCEANRNGGTGGNVDPSQTGNTNAGFIQVTTVTAPVTISTNGTDSPAVAALVQGGAGGFGGFANPVAGTTAGYGGAGGDITAPIQIQLTGTAQYPIKLTTSGNSSPGVAALSAGGAGGEGGDTNKDVLDANGGAGGSGGSGNDISISLVSTSITTSGTDSTTKATPSPGIVAVSEGGVGGQGGLGSTGGGGNGGNGGVGGNAGDVTVTLDAASSISTSTADSSGIVALSLSGGGGNAMGATGLVTTGGNGGAGGNAGDVKVNNSGKISTQGASARGILAQSMSGTGGGGGFTGAGFYGSAGTGASSGAAGTVTVQNNGSITTVGDNAEGILAQSIGGSGGAGGAGAGFVAVGGDGDTNPLIAAGGTVNINTSAGFITTSGTSAIGILGQSIGGGGGDGGGASGVFSSIGGTAEGAGGAGGAVSSTNILTNNLNTVITTNGDFSPAFVLQSIGGGGGNGGNAESGGPFATVAVGGNGGIGGAGGSASFNIASSTITPVSPMITTVGTKSPGLVVQSIGGGGGTGGNAFATSVGVGFSASWGVGGTGGTAGDGGPAQAQVTAGTIATGQNSLLTSGAPVCTGSGGVTGLPCAPLPVDSYGVLVQSIGGGGGLGGSASAQSIAVETPTPGVQLAMAITAAVGGTGGAGGDGGAANFGLSNGGKILTSGQGSTGVLAQSIGGGGGAGGDSSALAVVVGYFGGVPEGTESISAVGSVAMGGKGGAGGSGGNVNVVLSGALANCSSTGCSFQQDSSGSNSTSITTYGDFADGVVAQSIGGGGGDAGFGSSNSQAFGTGTNTSISVVLGSQGGKGGTGGGVRLDQYAGNSVTTFGSGAVGLMAQSIGGGGGTSQGGSVNVGESFEVKDSTGQPTSYSVGMTLNLGATGGSGNKGGDVTVSAMGPITTQGADATGIVAQSIGGGGGLGGSAGADASADNPVLQGLNARQAVSNWGDVLKGDSGGPFAGNLELSIGGTGGTGGDGGSVETLLYAPIKTAGDWANGIVAQSIGGGGGKGGVAVSSGTGGLTYINVNHDLAIGGTGGVGGDGGLVTVELDQSNQGGSSGHDTSISTAGFGAAGVIAQSIGGGGGIGADGSDSATGTLSVGGATGGKGGAAGNGGTVALTYYNTDPASTHIITNGDAADGVDLQSIGGGGGIAGAGSSLFVGTGVGNWQLSKTLTLSAGGGQAASGSGGAVSFAPSSTGDTPIAISTTGNDSFGILAQSIGGGGGLVTSQQSSSAPGGPTLTIGGASSDQSNVGGAVSVTLGSQGTITTTGIAAHGIVAQSIGGGGGIIRLVNLTGDSPMLSTSPPSGLSAPGNSKGEGGTVNVEVDGGVSVSGAGAVGILAQSLGGGGALVINGNSIYAGSPNVSQGAGQGGPVTITATGSVSATGAAGIGIFAQSSGYGSSPVGVTVGGSVVGGSGQAATSDQSGNSTQLGASAIEIDSASGGNVVTVNSGGSLTTMSGTSGTAIVQVGSGTTNLTNDGTITGSTYLGNGGTLTNTGGGVYNAGPDVQGDVVNHGTVNLGLPGELRSTHVTGDFTQTGEGRLGVTVDSLNKTAGHLQVDGTATLDGKIVPTVLTLLPGALPVVSAGHLVSTADGLDSLLFHWDTAQSGNTLTLAPRSDFKPGGVSLNGSQASLAGYYGRAWDNADAAFATRFAQLSRMNDHSDYKAALDAWSSKAAHAQSIALANSAGTILGAGLSCPVFIDDTVLLGEDNCVWAKVSGRWTDQSTTHDTQGYYVSGTTYRIGAQHEIAPEWYLGASFGFGQSWATMDGGSSGNGDTYDGSVTVKRVMGPWQFAGSVAFAGGSFEANRRVVIPAIADETLKSDPSIFLAGGRLRAAYEFAFQDWYIRPYGDLDVVYTDLPGFKEKGDDLYALDVRGSSKTSVALSPMVEFGGRLDLDAQSTLRAYAAFGLSYQPDSTRTIHSSFVGASSADGTFSDHIDSPDVLGRIDVGLQLFRAGGYELKGEYTADIGGSYLSQSASARFAYHF